MESNGKKNQETVQAESSENITVVNKPSNMPTHESLNNHGNTLANALKYRYMEKNYVFRALYEHKTL